MKTMQTLKRVLLHPWLVLVLIVAAGAGWITLRASRAQPPLEQTQPLPVVEVEEVVTRSLVWTVQGIGTLEAHEIVEIRPQITGRIKAIHFEQGNPVEQGALLVTLDDEKLVHQRAARQAGVQVARVAVATAQSIFDRQAQLRQRGATSPYEWERAQEDLESAIAQLARSEAELALLGEQLADTRIAAPFAGHISRQKVHRGAYVVAGDDLATLYRNDPMEIGFAIPERYLGQVHVGQPVDVTVQAYPDEVFEATVHYIAPAVDAITRTFEVRGLIANSDHRLRPGIFAAARLKVDVRDNRPVIADEALVATRSGYMVFVVQDDQVYPRAVETGLHQNGLVEIVKGLAPGERVVRRGHLQLHGQQQVRVVGPDDVDPTPVDPSAQGSPGP